MRKDKFLVFGAVTRLTRVAKKREEAGSGTLNEGCVILV